MVIQSLVPSCSPAAASNSSAPVNTLIADHSPAFGAVGGWQLPHLPTPVRGSTRHWKAMVTTPPSTGTRMGTPTGRWVLLVTILGSGMAMLDATVVNIALPAIGREFGAGFRT